MSVSSVGAVSAPSTNPIGSQPAAQDELSAAFEMQMVQMMMKATKGNQDLKDEAEEVDAE